MRPILECHRLTKKYGSFFALHAGQQGDQPWFIIAFCGHAIDLPIRLTGQAARG